MAKYAIVTGFSGMDGPHMADYLLKNTDLMVIGVNRRQSNPNTINYHHLLNNPRVIIESADITDPISINNLIQKYKPDYFFNFCAQSHVHESWGTPAMTFQTNAMGVLNCLEAIRLYHPACRFYSAGTSEQFSEPCYLPMDELHTQSAKSPYAASKIAAFHLVNCYRKSYNLYAIHGVLFNHESERRSKAFLPRKISSGVAQIWYETKEGRAPTVIQIGDMYSKRDWSYSPDFIEAIWMMMNQELYRKDLQPEYYREGPYSKEAISGLREYVLASGETHSVKELIELAFFAAGFSIYWKGEGINEKGYIFNDLLVVEVNEKFYRPADVIYLHGTPKKIKEDLGWEPKVDFKNLVKKMVDFDIKNYKE
jgi:GDPmannose 4,6-dehydratase